MYTLELDCIGTHLSLRVESSSSVTIDEDFLHIRSYLISFEEKYSRFIPDNWLHKLNIAGGGLLNQDANNMFSYALELARRTDGYFDPTVGKKLRELGYGNPLTEIKAEYISNLDSGSGDYRSVIIEGDHISLENGVEIECGGVGKGYLIDQIQTLLEAYPRFLINFGGDLYGRGGWKVGLESPFASDQIIGVIILENHYLACSAPTRRKWGEHHHLIDPKTGESAREVIGAFIEGGSGIVTDGYATALSVMPWIRACEALDQTPEISGVLVKYDGTFYQKEGSRSEIFR